MNNKKKKNMLPALAMAGPVSVWMILFVTIPMLYIIYISFMSRWCIQVMSFISFRQKATKRFLILHILRLF